MADRLCGSPGAPRWRVICCWVGWRSGYFGRSPAFVRSRSVCPRCACRLESASARPFSHFSCAFLSSSRPHPRGRRLTSAAPVAPHPLHPVAPSQDLDWSIPSGWFFSEAGESAAHGYTIADDDHALMWSEFNRLGGWRSLGFPASRRFIWHGELSQATQRAVLQWSPITGQVEFADVLDLLHDDGFDADLKVTYEIPPPVDVDEAGLPYETIAARRLAWLDERPAIKTGYCRAPGGADPVRLWGLPTSHAVNVSATGEVYVLRTQRAVFQEWVDGADWAARAK
jgi:hypothetical protein